MIKIVRPSNLLCTQLQEELRATMHQLDSIRAELSGGLNIFQPGPLARKALNMKNLDVPSSSTTREQLRDEGKGHHHEVRLHGGPAPQPPAAPFLPISASAAGLVPDRTKSAPSGAEILSDALQEEHVAHSAAAYFQLSSTGDDNSDNKS